MVTPANRKPVVTYLKEHYALSERRACELATVSRTGYRHQGEPPNDRTLRERLDALARQYPRYGYLMLHSLLKAEGLVINRKRTYRLYKEAGLQVRTKKRKKLTRPAAVMTTPVAPNLRWSMDFVSDQLSCGRRFRILNVVDDHSREVVGQLVRFSITGQQVARFLDQLADSRGLPDEIVCDNGTEFTCKAMFFWSQERGTALRFIQPGKPTQNAFVESLNGKFRNECLNQHWFLDLAQADRVISEWRHHYNHIRPHSSLGYLSPVAFVNRAA